MKKVLFVCVENAGRSRMVDYVVTMGCNAESVCPAPLISEMQKRLVDW